MPDSTGIIVLGANGRMGKTIIGLVSEDQRFHLAGAVDRREHLPQLSSLGTAVAPSLDKLETSPQDVIIDFSTPDASIAAAGIAASRGLPMVLGTTGFSASQKQDLEKLAKMSPLFWSANMSIGVNVLLRVLPQIASALGPGYDVEMVELHHRRKKDSPSGTALMLGEAVARAKGWQLDACRCSCRDGIIGERPDAQIGIQALRGGDVVGIHTCYFMGPGEVISVTHQAESRENFAQGALRAALWLRGRQPGRLYSMADVLDDASR